MYTPDGHRDEINDFAQKCISNILGEMSVLCTGTVTSHYMCIFRSRARLSCVDIDASRGKIIGETNIDRLLL